MNSVRYETLKAPTVLQVDYLELKIEAYRQRALMVAKLRLVTCSIVAMNFLRPVQNK